MSNKLIVLKFSGIFCKNLPFIPLVPEKKYVNVQIHQCGRLANG
jgi:hypothetical protein